MYVVTVSLMQLKLTPFMTTHNPLWHMCAFHLNWEVFRFIREIYKEHMSLSLILQGKNLID